MRVACILAAGLGSRLKSLTSGMTKCMVEINGQPLIQQLLGCLDRLDYDRYVIVTGHMRDQLRGFLQEHCDAGKFEFVDNPTYATTNNIFSLSLASSRLVGYDEIHLFESDVWVRPDVLLDYLSAPVSGGSVLVSPYEYWMDGTCTTLDEDRRISAFIQKADLHRYSRDQLYKTVNIYKFTGAFFCSLYMPSMEAYIRTRGKTAYYEEVLRVLVPVGSSRLDGFVISPNDWMEIDDAEDLRRTEVLAQPVPEARHTALVAQYGGYWKSSTTTDLTLPVNPYFPTAEFLAEFQQETATAISSYPSTQSIIASIASKSCDFEPHQIAVGNGASELMQALFACVPGPVTLCPPTFLEYERLLGGRVHKIARSFPEDCYRESLLAAAKHSESHLVVVNPNNPTGEWLDRDAVLSLADLQTRKGRLLIVDESFADFGEGISCAERSLVQQHPSLVILRSYGKSHGVGGLRLGALFSTDAALVQLVRAALPIWNVSAFAEIFLDLLPKYKDQFRASLGKVREDRERLAQRLRTLGLIVAPSAANFLLVEIAEPLRQRVAAAFLNEGLLIKVIEREGLNGTHVRFPLKGAALDGLICDLFDKLLHRAD